MPIQNILLVLSCESHPKCKLKSIDNCIKRTLRKVNNPCTHKYKHRFFIPGGNSTSPSLIFLSLKLDIRGLSPQSSITLPLGVATNHLAKLKYVNGEMQELLKNSNIKEKNQIYYSSQSEHSLIIHQIPANSALSHAPDLPNLVVVGYHTSRIDRCAANFAAPPPHNRRLQI